MRLAQSAQLQISLGWNLRRLGQANGFDFIDGPVSGGPAAANAGTLTMLLAGNRDAIDRLAPVIDVLTAKSVVVGASGAGHAAKIGNNMLCAANLVLVAEAVRMCEAAGVVTAGLLEGVNAGSGRSGVSEVNFPKWVLTQLFAELFDDASKRKFDLVLFWALDRFSREGTFETISHLRMLDSYGINFHSYTEPFLCTDNDFAKEILLSMLSALAKQERVRRSQQIKAGQARAVQRGRKIGRKPKLTGSQLKHLERLVEAGMKPQAILNELKISRTTLLPFIKLAVSDT